jgi:hypothetical protein
MHDNEGVFAEDDQVLARQVQNCSLPLKQVKEQAYFHQISERHLNELVNQPLRDIKDLHESQQCI